MAKVLKKKNLSTKKLNEVVVEQRPPPKTKEQFITNQLVDLTEEINSIDFDSMTFEETLPKLGEIGHKYAVMSAQMEDGLAVVGYKRVFKVLLLGVSQAEAARQRG